MIIVNKNEGRKIDYAVYGTEIVFGNDELTLNLADIQDDWDIHVTVCYNKHHALTTGRGGITYVAEIDIPARNTPKPSPPRRAALVKGFLSNWIWRRSSFLYGLSKTTKRRNDV